MMYNVYRMILVNMLTVKIDNLLCNLEVCAVQVEVLVDYYCCPGISTKYWKQVVLVLSHSQSNR